MRTILSLEAFLKRINFSLEQDCHSLLRSACALKGITLNDYIYNCVNEVFHKDILKDNQLQQLLLAGEYPKGSRSYDLQQRVKGELSDY